MLAQKQASTEAFDPIDAALVDQVDLLVRASRSPRRDQL